MIERPRRNRKSQFIRDLIAETNLSINHLVYPVFIQEGHGTEIPIKAMPGQFRMSPDILVRNLANWTSLGLKHLALFPAIEDSKKDKFGKEATNENGLLPNTIKKIKDLFPELNLITDIALDPYSSDGHDGVVENGKILNDVTLDILAKMAVSHAKWGADWVAPSDMMDGRVQKIRSALDSQGFHDTNILSYTAKYASSFYGPFREALSSAPKFGDKKTYQMDFRNSTEAVREARLDVSEGADMLMVKPGLSYLDIVSLLKRHTDIPIAVYNVSGEYSMIKFAAQAGAINEEKIIIESLTAFRRAGASAIFTYFAIDAAKILHQS